MVSSPGTAELRELARRVRRDVLEISYASRSGHIGSALSAADLLTALYFHYLRVDPAGLASERDRFIMSKGHACAAYYAVLCRRGFFARAFLEGFGKDGGTLSRHPSRAPELGIDASTGSLGHGLSIAAGLAFSAKQAGASWRTAVMLSDGEQNEGSVWEAALFAGHHKQDNLLAVVDCNQMQALGFTREIADLSGAEGLWRSFGWGVRRINGHDMDAVVRTLDAFPFEPGRPSVVLADTVKGKGVSFMENQLLWHYRCPDANEYARALAEIDAHA